MLLLMSSCIPVVNPPQEDIYQCRTLEICGLNGQGYKEFFENCTLQEKNESDEFWENIERPCLR